MPFFIIHPAFMRSLVSFFIAGLLLVFPDSGAQIITTDPAIPVAGEPVTITYDATLGSAGLKDYTGDVYAHTGVLTDKSSGGSDWRYVKTDWGENSADTKLTRVADNLYTLEITPAVRDYYGVPQSETITHMAFVFRSSDSSKEGKGDGGGDIFVKVFKEGLSLSIITPEKNLVVTPGTQVEFEAASSETAVLTLYQDGSVVKSLSGDRITHSFSFPAPGDSWIRVTAETGGEIVADSVFVHAMDTQPEEPVPAGMTDGINYIDDQTVRLVLYAPLKEHVFVIGDFNDWVPQSGSQMVKDGDRYWITLGGLDPGREYAFQYLVDGSLCIADPYTEKTSDPSDEGISEATYSGLKPYPAGLANGIASVFQTAQESYTWTHQDFTHPDKENLVIYELLLRDFIAAHDWKTLTDTLDYFSNLGVNAIELMPVNEFEGNESWGYNPSFYFAPDKYYGPADDLRTFIDSCHGRGIAVIIDMVLNHSYGQSPLVQMYFEEGKPSADNPWYNVSSPNPVYSWGYDFNHESQHTKTFVDRVNRFWIESFHVDGFRFDFTKGFTNKPGDGWSYDASRISILKRMASTIWTVDSDAYVILEHLSENSEEKELAAYGMMLWGNLNHPYGEATMGYHEDNKSNFGGISYTSRGWSDPHLVGYMESHDEERLMYKNLTYGNVSGDYDIQELNTALERLEMAGVFFFTVPGPKMIWQFGELGYDYSIDYGCRVCNKPIRWDYNQGIRKRVYQVWSSLIGLKHTEPAFGSEDFQLHVTGPAKRIEINHESMDVRILGNFDLAAQAPDPSFSRTGWWYEYFSGDSLNVTAVHGLITLKPGEYRIYTTKRLTPPRITASVPDFPEMKDRFHVYPNPVFSVLHLPPVDLETRISFTDLNGKKVMELALGQGEGQVDLSRLPGGIYLLIRSAEGRESEYTKIIKTSR